MSNLSKNLLSSVAMQGRFVTQVIQFSDGYRKTIHNIDTHTIEQGEFTKFRLKDGRMMMINDRKVLYIEVFPEDSKDGS